MHLLKSLKRIIVLLLAFFVVYNCYSMLGYVVQAKENRTVDLFSKEYVIDYEERIVKRILPETEISSFKAKFNVPENDITIYTDSSCSREATTGFVTSGMILKTKGSQINFQICVIGDLDNDGKMGEIELNRLIKHVVGLNENKLTGKSAISGDINGDGKIDQVDITILIRWIVYKVLDIPEVKLPQAPVIEIVDGEKAENNWYKSDVKVKITTKNELGAKISKLTYKLGDTEEKQIDSGSIITLSENGINSIIAYTYSENGARNNCIKEIKIEKEELLDDGLKVISNPKTSSISINVELPKGSKAIEYAYYIGLKDEDGDIIYKKVETNSDNSYIYTGLKQETKYYIKVKVKTESGHILIKETEETTNKVLDLQNTDIILRKSEENWTNQDVTVELLLREEIREDYKIEYSLDNGSTYEKYDSNKKITIKQNSKIVIRLTDEINITNSVEESISNIDKTKPIQASITLSKKEEITGVVISASVTQSDNESGILIENCKWIYNTTKDEIGTDNEIWNTANKFNNTTEEINLTALKKGTYYLHVLTVDNAGNKIEKVSEAVKIRQLVTQILLNKNSADIRYEATEKLTATIEPSDADNKNIVWTSSNENVATVDENGQINAVGVGETIITAEAQDGSNVSSTCMVTVSSKQINDDFTVTLDETTYTYDGTAKTPNVTVKNGEKLLVKDRDYTISYENNINAGNAIVNITGIDNYTGTKSIGFTINKAENTLTVSNPSIIYVGTEVNLANNVYNNQGEVSYEIKSTNETTPGTLNSSTYTAGVLSTSNDNNGAVVITVTAEGNENYKPKSSDITITVRKYTPILTWTSTTPDNITFNTTGKSATVSATSDGGSLGTITYSSSNTNVLTINATTGELTTLSGTGSSTITANISRTSTVKIGSVTKIINIAKDTNPILVNANSNLVYTGSALSLVTASNVQGTVYYSTTGSLNESNYQTSGSTSMPKGTNAGNYTIYYYVTGNANYNSKSGSVVATIAPKNVQASNISITVNNENYIYDGTAKTPGVTVKDGDKILVKGTDYTTGYENNINAGNAIVNITGIGNYTGTKSAEFTISKAENTLTVSNPDTIYVGRSVNLANNVSNNQGTVSYSVKSTNETTRGSLNSSTYTAGSLSTSNDNNGTVVVTATAAGNDNYEPKSRDITITVQKFTPTLTWTSATPNYITYNTSGKSATVSASSIGGSLGTVTYSSSNTSVLTINSSTGALTTISGTGSSTITANIARTSTVKAGSTTKTINASKASNPAFININPDLVHTGSALNLVTARDVQGTVYYSVGAQLNSSNYQTSGSTTIPKRTDVGSYTVYYYVTGNTNYDSVDGYIIAKIKQAVAQINTTRYDSLQSAINAVPTTGTETTIKLLEDIDEDVGITNGRNVNVNLNGKNITSANFNNWIFRVSDNATLKISGTGKIEQTNSISAIYANSGGNIEITGGTISSESYDTVTMYRSR